MRAILVQTLNANYLSQKSPFLGSIPQTISRRSSQEGETTAAAAVDAMAKDRNLGACQYRNDDINLKCIHTVEYSCQNEYGIFTCTYRLQKLTIIISSWPLKEQSQKSTNRKSPFLQNKSKNASTGDKGKGGRGNTKQMKNSMTIPSKVSKVPIFGEGWG